MHDPHHRRLRQSRSRLKSEVARTGHRRNVLERKLPPRSTEMQDAAVIWRWFSNNVSETLDSPVSVLCRGENHEVVTRTPGERPRSQEVTNSRKIPRRRTAHSWSESGRCTNRRQGSRVPARLVGHVVMVSGPIVQSPREQRDRWAKKNHNDGEDSSSR